ncbi:OmpA family protein [Adhaeribacter radiodurans]|uniref:OmpA family protein n=1 Tax=Adhaeribacter radiodurans TaxID=2745197 RepID=A0A7L7LB45_9BACT|nr:OmpA family protein [Adhaeribacter radiodurans]
MYKWQLKGYTGVANYYNPDKKTINYFKLEDNLWHRLEIGRSLGKTFGLAASASFGKVRGLAPQSRSFLTDVRMTSVRFYFYTDNGWLFKSSSFISPFFFGGYGLSTFDQGNNGVSTESKYRQVLPFGLGLKFRLTDRWQFDLQTEAVYNTNSSLNEIATEQNKYNNGFLHTGLALAYNFGFKPSSFKASRFYASFQDPLAQVDSTLTTTSPNLSKLTARSTLLTPPPDRLVNPRLIMIRDTVLISEKVKPQNNGTLGHQKKITQERDTMYSANRSRIFTQKSLIKEDTLRSAVNEKALSDRETAMADYELQNRRAASFRQVETARVQESLRTTIPYRTAPSTTTRVYQPGYGLNNNSRPSLYPAGQSSLMLLQKDKSELAEANRRNSELRYAYDSLYTALTKDTAIMTQLRQHNSSFKALDNRVLDYMQDQAALNESMKQRLGSYENELARLPQTDNSTSIVIPEVISGFDTNVFFRINSYGIPSQSFNSLLTCAALLNANPGKKLQLTGYTDKTGKPSYNLLLSRKRVEAVSDFFQDQGIGKERILMQYFGEAESDDRSNSLGRKVMLHILD